MLQKNDLAKQFELVVQQEIKNYQDSLNFVLQSIKELKESIEQVHNQSLDNYAIIHNQNNDLEIQLKLVQKSQSETQEKLKSHINDIEVFKRKAMDEIGMHGDRSMQNARQNEFNKAQIDHTNSRIELFKDEIIGYCLTISSSIENMKFNLSKDFKKMKQEILSLPSESETLRKEFEEKIFSNKIDVEGILKEIRINRKEMVIIAKKIENIYTLIERLKKSEAIS